MTRQGARAAPRLGCQGARAPERMRLCADRHTGVTLYEHEDDLLPLATRPRAFRRWPWGQVSGWQFRKVQTGPDGRDAMDLFRFIVHGRWYPFYPFYY